MITKIIDLYVIKDEDVGKNDETFDTFEEARKHILDSDPSDPTRYKFGGYWDGYRQKCTIWHERLDPTRKTLEKVESWHFRDGCLISHNTWGGWK